jgi:hypothetical protein
MVRRRNFEKSFLALKLRWLIFESDTYRGVVIVVDDFVLILILVHALLVFHDHHRCTGVRSHSVKSLAGRVARISIQNWVNLKFVASMAVILSVERPLRLIGAARHIDGYLSLICHVLLVILVYFRVLLQLQILRVVLGHALVHLVNLVTVNRGETFWLAPHAQARGSRLDILVISQVFFVLIFSAKLLLIQSAIRNPRESVSFWELKVLCFLGCRFLSTSGKPRAFDH